MASNLFDYLGEQNALSGIQDWAQQQYGQSNPGLAALAQADPRSFRELLPSLVGKQMESQAIQQFYGKPQGQPLQQGQPMDADAMLAPQPPQDDPIQRYQAFAGLPKELQALAGPQLAMSGLGGQGPGTGLTGEDFLKSLPSPLANQVKALDEGRLPFTSMSSRSPQMQALMQYAQQYDPEFDATVWQQRSKTAQDFNSTGGKSRQNITQIETALNHLASLKDASDTLGGWGFVNAALRNPIMDATSDPRLVAYNTISKTAADEVSKATAGPGGSTQADREERMKEFTAGQAPEARNSSIQSAIKLLAGRLEPLAANYNNAMGTSKIPTELLSPEAQKSYARITGNESPNITASGNRADNNVARGAPDNPIIQATQQQPQTIRNPKTGETAALGQDGAYYTRDGKRVR